MTVPAERAVHGRLPAVCVRTGTPADGTITLVTKVGGASPWSLVLLFFGPLGWIVLAVVSLTTGEDFSVRLPFAEHAWASVRRVGVAGYVLLGAAAFGCAAALLMHQTVLAVRLAFLLGACGAVVVLAAKAMLPRVKLDATRNVATIRHVHPAFRDAVRAEPAPDRADW